MRVLLLRSRDCTVLSRQIPPHDVSREMGHPQGPKILLAFLSIFATIALLCTIGCQTQDSYEKVDSSKRVTLEKAKKTSDKDVRPIVVAIASIISAQESFAQYSEFISYFEEKLKQPVKAIFCKKYRDVYRLFEKGQVDMAFICSALYVIAKRKGLLELLAVPVVNNKSVYQAYIIVPKTSRAQSFEDLRKQSFVFADELSLTGYFYPLYRSKQRQTMWGSTRFSGSHDYSIQLVNKGIVDGASIDGLVYDDMAKRYPKNVENTRVIEKSREFGIPPVVVSANMDIRMKKKLQGILITMNTEDKGRLCCRELAVEKFVLPNEKLYDSIFKIVPESVEP